MPLPLHASQGVSSVTVAVYSPLPSQFSQSLWGRRRPLELLEDGLDPPLLPVLRAILYSFFVTCQSWGERRGVSESNLLGGLEMSRVTSLLQRQRMSERW